METRSVVLIPIRLNNVDLRIIRVLSDDGRISYSDISRIVAVSAGTARNRINRMRASGLLHVNVWFDPYRSGLGVNTILLLKIRSGRVDKVMPALADLDETGHIASLAGTWDVIVDAFCNDVAHLRRFIHDKIQRIDGVLDVSTHLVTQIKYDSNVNVLGVFDPAGSDQVASRL